MKQWIQWCLNISGWKEAKWSPVRRGELGKFICFACVIAIIYMLQLKDVWNLNIIIWSIEKKCFQHWVKTVGLGIKSCLWHQIEVQTLLKTFILWGPLASISIFIQSRFVVSVWKWCADPLKVSQNNTIAGATLLVWCKPQKNSLCNHTHGNSKKYTAVT